MKAREYLMQIREIETEIGQISDEHDRVLNQLHGLQGIRQDKDKIQAPKDDKTVALISYLYENGQEMSDRLQELYRVRRDIIDKINRLHNFSYSDLLYKRYVEYKNMETIANEMCYSYDRAVHIHAEALKALEMLQDDIQ